MDLKPYLEDEAATLAHGRALGEACMNYGKSLVIYLVGSLGAGKTTFSRGLLRGMGHAGKVRSPTYTLMENYDTDGLPVAHLDLYRLADPEELEFVGLRDMADAAHILLVEWPEKGAGHLPAADVIVALEMESRGERSGRRLNIEPATPEGRTALQEAAGSRSHSK